MNDDILTAPARRIREAREKMGWTRDEVAARVGVTRQTVIKWERTDQWWDPTWKNTMGLARVLAIDPQELFTLYALADLERARRREGGS